MEQSQDIQFSDCIRKVENTLTQLNDCCMANDYHQVYRHPFQQAFQLDFTISLGEGREGGVSGPITITEVNGQTCFNIRGIYYDCTMCSTL